MRQQMNAKFDGDKPKWKSRFVHGGDRKAQPSASYISLLILLAGCSALSLFGATLTVTNTNDSGAGSLRDAIAAANPGDTINFSVTGTITLGSTLTITKDLTISGPSASSLAISGNNTFRVFLLTATVAISGITIEYGRSYNDVGGGIVNTGTLTISDGMFSGNTGYNGGGIFNTGACRPATHSSNSVWQI